MSYVPIPLSGSANVAADKIREAVKGLSSADLVAALADASADALVESSKADVRGFAKMASQLSLLLAAGGMSDIQSRMLREKGDKGLQEFQEMSAAAQQDALEIVQERTARVANKPTPSTLGDSGMARSRRASLEEIGRQIGQPHEIGLPPYPPAPPRPVASVTDSLADADNVFTTFGVTVAVFLQNVKGGVAVHLARRPHNAELGQLLEGLEREPYESAAAARAAVNVIAEALDIKLGPWKGVGA